MTKPYVEELKRRVLIYDGAMGTNIDLYNLTAEDYGGEAFFGCRDNLVLTRPDVIGAIHASFLEAGSDVLETCTFQSTRIRLEEWGLADKTYEINHAAAKLARGVADRFEALDGRKRFVAGSMGPTGKLPSSNDPVLSDITFDQISDYCREQAVALIEGGADLIIIETSVDILEVKAAIDGVRRARKELGREDIAIQAQAMLDFPSGRWLLGTDIPAMITTLEAMQVDVIGLNCSTGPEHMREAIRLLCRHSRLPISCIPNAGLPIEVDGETVYPMEPEPFAKILGEFVHELGVAVVGGCCGTTPAHLAQVRAVVGQATPPKQREIEYIPSVSSGIRAVALRQEPAPLMVGERVNSLGSRKVKRLLLADDYDGILEVAREQVDSGSHVLDIGVAMTERPDEKEQMVTLVKKLTLNVELPLVIDTTEADVLKATLEIYPGRAIVNSLSLEGGRGDKIDRVMPLVARYGAATVAMTIDESGMAHSAEHKAEIAARIAQIANDEYGVPNEALIYDVITFPLTTGEESLKPSAINTLRGITLVKERVPGCSTVLGVSNLSFGVAPHARGALNSVFLYHAVQAGLDLAIINPAHVTPYAEIPAEQRELCEDLIFNRQEQALARFINYYEQNAASATEDTRVDPTAGMSAEERLHWKILHRKKEGVEADIDEALGTRLDAGAIRGEAAVDILNNVLLPAMKQVGDLFGAGQLILPFVLQSAEVMKKTVAYLEQYFDKLEGVSKGKVVLATVYGDVHDIGKSLVNTILSNNGYTVYDLGKQVPINTILEKAVEVKADAIGLSALLVSTSKQMPLCLQELHKRGLHIPVLVGGAAINAQYGQRILFVEPGVAYDPGVFYCKDAFEGLETVDALMDPAERERFIGERREQARLALAQPERGRTVLEKLGRESTPGVRSSVRQDVPVPVPPFWGARTTERIRLEDVYECLDLNTLFRLHWGAKNNPEYERLKEQEFLPRLRQLQREAKEQGWLQPKICYGFFQAQSQNNDLILYDPAAPDRQLTRFFFPRQPERDRLCLADYFRTVESGERDLAAFLLVTAGHAATELIDRLQREGDYSRAYFIHGFAASLAEALAEYTNRLMRQTLGLSAERGKRYAWGYPAIPDLSDHSKLFEILPVGELGMELTEAYQLVPEQSTAAIVVHHPEAKYFSIGGSARERAEGDAS